ncbi:MAG: hypothetical protein RIC82_09320, partial [Parvibaculum sp.]
MIDLGNDCFVNGGLIGCGINDTAAFRFQRRDVKICLTALFLQCNFLFFKPVCCLVCIAAAGGALHALGRIEVKDDGQIGPAIFTGSPFELMQEFLVNIAGRPLINACGVKETV